MIKKILLLVITIVFSAFCVFSAVSCGTQGVEFDDGSAEVKVEYTISFDSDGGSEVAAKKLSKGDNYVFETPTREDYIFLGWYLGEEKIENSGVWSRKGSVTLKAKWQSVEETFDYVEENGEITITAYKGEDEDVVIPASINGVPVKNLSKDAFKNNAEITSVSFDGSFTNYPAKLFEGCVLLESLILSGSYDKPLYYLFGEDVSAVPQELTYLAFAKNSETYSNAMFKSELTNHFITLYVDYAGANFENCSYLQAVVIADEITSISANEFKNCVGLDEVTVPNGLTAIGAGAFEGCINLFSLYLTDGLTSIGENAFKGCNNLRNIKIPSGVISIGTGAFEGCAKIASVSIPVGVGEIAAFTFKDCVALETIVIESGVEAVGEGAFSGCVKLDKLYYKGTAEDWANLSIGTDNSDLTDYASRYYYCETEPDEDNVYWHYDNGKIVIWIKDTGWTQTH